MTSLINAACKTKVSSVLNRDVKQFGKQFMFDGSEETCWNSDQGSPQFVVIDFERRVSVAELRIMFQGGFVGKECRLEANATSPDQLESVLTFYPEDNNKLQSFALPTPCSATRLKVVFGSSTDFYGRITVYKMEAIGNEA